jgi:GDPmannose 4,6-dehydratase
MSFKYIGIDIEWSGEGCDEIGVDVSSGKCLVKVDPKYFRPTEVDELLGDSTKARTQLGWKPEYSVNQLCKEMVENDIKRLK